MQGFFPFVRQSVCLSVYQSVCSSVHLSVCPSVLCPRVLPVCVYLSVGPSACLPVRPVCLPVFDSLSVSVCRSVGPSVYLSVFVCLCPSVCASVYLSVFLSVCLSLCLSLCVFVSLSVYFHFSYSSILSNVLDEIEVIEPHIDETNRQLYEVQYPLYYFQTSSKMTFNIKIAHKYT